MSTVTTGTTGTTLKWSDREFVIVAAIDRVAAAAADSDLLRLSQRMLRGDFPATQELQDKQLSLEYGGYWAEAAAVAAIRLATWGWWEQAAEAAAKSVAIYCEKIIVGQEENDQEIYDLIYAKTMDQIKKGLAACR
jgi:hypothetical protein